MEKNLTQTLIAENYLIGNFEILGTQYLIMIC